MKEVLIVEKRLNKPGGSVWMRAGGSSAVAIPLGNEASETIE